MSYTIKNHEKYKHYYGNVNNYLFLIVSDKSNYQKKIMNDVNSFFKSKLVQAFFMGILNNYLK